MNNILNDLYHGRIVPCERHAKDTLEQAAVNQKIEEEKQYFTERMSVEDQRRFRALVDLYTQSGTVEEEEAFAYGFRLGALMAGAVFTKEN